jgi:hypothetical protein
MASVFIVTANPRFFKSQPPFLIHTLSVMKKGVESTAPLFNLFFWGVCDLFFGCWISFHWICFFPFNPTNRDHPSVRVAAQKRGWPMSVPSFLFFWNFGDTQWKWKDENVHETMIPCIDECKENNSKWNWNETQIDKIETKLFSKEY